MDGNGRVGRLLITLMLVHSGVLHRPLLYLSFYLKRRREEYYDLLMAVRDNGAWEQWIGFFLAGVAETAMEATVTARAIVQLREEQRTTLLDHLPPNALRLLDFIYLRPVVDVGLVADRLDLAFATANKLVASFEELGLLREVTGRKRDRIFRFAPYLALFEEAQDSAAPSGTLQETEGAGG